ncbi:MAG: ATPase [Bryobacterales bacterium]|nr:ATPase [Bryobacterales bacterium]
MSGGGLFLGVDGGQSSTRAVVGDASGAILARAVGGPGNQVSAGIGETNLGAVMAGLLRDALQAARLPEESAFEAACFAMSGGPGGKEAILNESIRAGAVKVTTDADAALEGASPGMPGIAVIAGTGSMALGRDQAGRTVRCGGWGYAFGDEGGAFDIVRRAVRKALAAEEGWGEPTALRETLIEATASKTVNEALHRFYTSEWPRDRIARLAPTVDLVATEGDPVACRVMKEAGSVLGSLTEIVEGCLPRSDPDLTIYPVGGVFHSRLVRESFEFRLEPLDLRIGEPAHDAPVGALLMAYRLRGLSPEIRDEG